MRTQLSVKGSTLYEVQERAHLDLQKFYGEVPYRVTGASAHPDVRVVALGGTEEILSWEADYEAESTP